MPYHHTYLVMNSRALASEAAAHRLTAAAAAAVTVYLIGNASSIMNYTFNYVPSI